MWYIQAMTQPLEQSQRRLYMVSEYLRLEGDSTEKHEYRDGQILAMAGGSYFHSLIIANVVGELRNFLKGKPCCVLEGNLRVKNQRRAFYTYPDASVICGEPQFDAGDSTGQTVLNPKVLIEVLSPSTEAYDRGDKFDAYRGIDSLHEYILVNQDSARVESFLRQPEGSWLLTFASGLEASIRIRSIGADLTLREIYREVQFPSSKKAPPEAKAEEA